MWRSGSLSIRGASHLAKDTENQDVVLTQKIADAQLIVVCDGAGSAKNSVDGANELASTIHRVLSLTSEAILKDPANNSQEIKRLVEQAITETRDTILSGKIKQSKDAKKTLKMLAFPDWLANYFKSRNDDVLSLPIDINDFCSTMLVALVCDDKAWFGHIGDGFIFGLHVTETSKTSTQPSNTESVSSADTASSESYAVQSVFSSLPENGEYDNQTYFFTDDKWQDHFRVGFFNGEFNFVILFSDGADPFLVERNRADFVGSHAISIWKASQKSDELEVSELLEKFFPEQKVHAVSSDDTSIGLLVR